MLLWRQCVLSRNIQGCYHYDGHQQYDDNNTLFVCRRTKKNVWSRNKRCKWEHHQWLFLFLPNFNQSILYLVIWWRLEKIKFSIKYFYGYSFATDKFQSINRKKSQWFTLRYVTRTKSMEKNIHHIQRQQQYFNTGKKRRKKKKSIENNPLKWKKRRLN